MSADRPSLAYVIGTYPLLTTTFVDREIREVERRGIQVRVVSLRRPGERMLSPAQVSAIDSVNYVRPIRISRMARAHVGFLLTHPMRLLGTFSRLATLPHDSLRSRIRTILHVGLGVVVADMLRSWRPGHIHAHFVDRAAVVAWVSSRLLDVPFSVTAHANDIYVSPVLLADKLSAAKFAVTCTEYNLAHLSRHLGPHRAQIVAIHHGIDLESFPPPSHAKGGRPLVLAVGQLKEKKGFRHLIAAIASMALDVEVVIAGEGPLRPDLEGQIASLGLGERIRLLGSVPHERVLELMQRASVFVLPAVVAADGDRDGIPNVILEAMAMALPIVSTRHSGIPEAVIDGVTGLLVEIEDPDALADALTRLLDDPAAAARMGAAGRELVAERFDIGRNVAKLLDLVGA
jgi:glycosyltransferase involved in cell wall biosynthesis